MADGDGDPCKLTLDLDGSGRGAVAKFSLYSYFPRLCSSSRRISCAFLKTGYSEVSICIKLLFSIIVLRISIVVDNVFWQKRRRK